MPDIIRLLPDALANQIAAGEVIQRPASVVKELLENSVDAGATHIQLIVKDAGRTLVQVIDNGKGMSETDARMAFERHATSKIKDINDLFSLYTMGFRGEAMASIGAVAHVELKTKTPDHEIGTCVIMEGSRVVLQEAAAHPAGTSISVRNLFYNVPARRNFLKSNPIETKHILEEFMHVALANPQIYFTMHHNNMEVYHLRPGNLRQRIVGVFGKSYNEKLVPVEETTDYVSVRGFIGKPDIAKKTRGEQFFFVNNRFIKNNFLNHAISKAYEGLIADKSFPFYCLFIDINPASIDINVHPTKQEIKFEDEKAIYLLLHAAAKHGLSQYSVMPTIDFEHESTFSQLVDEKVYTQQPFKVVQSRMNGGQSGRKEEFRTPREASNFTHWEKLYAPEDVLPPDAITVQSRIDMEEAPGADEPLISHKENVFQPVQLHGRYILTQIKSGFILIDQQRAHQRIRFERYLQYLSNQPANSQQTLFPKTLALNPADSALLEDLLPELRVLGFDIQPFGNNTFVVHGLPADLVDENETKLIEDLLEQFKRSGRSEGFDKRQQVARSLAYQTAIAPGTPMDARSMQVLIDDLFACEQPGINPAGLPTFIAYTFDELNEKFGS